MIMHNEGWQGTGDRCKCGISDYNMEVSRPKRLRQTSCGTNLCDKQHILRGVVSWDILLGKAQGRKYLLKVPIPEGKREPLFKANAITVSRGWQGAKAGIGEGKSRR